MQTFITVNEPERQAIRYETDDFVAVTDINHKRQILGVDTNDESFKFTIEPINNYMMVTMELSDEQVFMGPLDEMLKLLQAGEALKAIKDYLSPL